MLTEPYIIFVEDERPVFELVRHALKLAGYEVVWAEEGQRGLELMRQRKPDLVILDLMMPNLNGWSVYQEMKKDEELSDIAVIVVSARIPQNGLSLIEGIPPVEDYITKPFNLERLVRAVKRHT